MRPSTAPTAAVGHAGRDGDRAPRSVGLPVLDQQGPTAPQLLGEFNLCREGPWPSVITLRQHGPPGGMDRVGVAGDAQGWRGCAVARRPTRSAAARSITTWTRTSADHRMGGQACRCRLPRGPWRPGTTESGATGGVLGAFWSLTAVRTCGVVGEKSRELVGQTPHGEGTCCP
jgi:hypothetical protein